MSVPVNPTSFTITDPSASAQNVTGFTVHVGTTTGGPYGQSFPVPSADLSGLSAGTVTGKLADLNMNLAPGTYFGVATAVNAAGQSLNSPEAEWTVMAVPGPPTGFTVA